MRKIKGLKRYRNVSGSEFQRRWGQKRFHIWTEKLKDGRWIAWTSAAPVNIFGGETRAAAVKRLHWAYHKTSRFTVHIPEVERWRY